MDMRRHGRPRFVSVVVHTPSKLAVLHSASRKQAEIADPRACSWPAGAGPAKLEQTYAQQEEIELPCGTHCGSFPKNSQVSTNHPHNSTLRSRKARWGNLICGETLLQVVPGNPSENRRLDKTKTNQKTQRTRKYGERAHCCQDERV